MTEETKESLAKVPLKGKERTRVDVGEEYASEGRYEEALHEFREAIKDNPRDAAAHLQIGLIYFYVQKKPKDAVAQIKKALEIDHNMPDAYYNLGYIYAKAGQYDDAIDLYRRTIAISPK